jgi:hypothetical protein
LYEKGRFCPSNRGIRPKSTHLSDAAKAPEFDGTQAL